MKAQQLSAALVLWLSTAVATRAAIHYVDVNNFSPSPPYTSWAAAATTIQDAVDAADAGDQILVTNGVYQTGGKEAFGTANRVSVDKSLVLQSVNGPEVTWISGIGAMRCVRLVNDCLLAGFTLTNGFAGPFGSGGGVAFADFDSSAVVSNCVIVGCIAKYGGGAGPGNGVYGYAPLGGRLINCLLRSSSASHGDFYLPGVGGGAYGTTLYNCVLTGNSATGGYFGGGGAVSSSRLWNCILTNNSASSPGGGAVHSELVNCTLTGNSSPSGGGALSSKLINCIAYYNSEPNHSDSSVEYSCTTPLPGSGVGNITDEPLFLNLAGGNLRLHTHSSCINAGTNTAALGGTDLDGRPRIVGGTVDMGAYEFQAPASLLSYAWAQRYGLPTDGSADQLDPDQDRMNNWQEWIAGTLPNDADSLLRMFSPVRDGTGVVVSWQSVSNRTYYLERATDIGAAPSFGVLQTDIPGQPGTTSFTDRSATGSGPFFYRVGVQP